MKCRLLSFPIASYTIMVGQRGKMQYQSHNALLRVKALADQLEHSLLLKHQHYQLIIFVAALAASDQHCLSRGGKDLRLAKLVLHCFQKFATIAKGFSTTTSVIAQD